MRHTIEQALIGQAQPFMLEAKIKALIHDEITKGCRPELCPEPVSLEPPYQPIMGRRDLLNPDPQPLWSLESPPDLKDLVRFRVWISPEQEFDWRRCELFVRQLQGARRRVCFELRGNDQGLILTLLAHHPDVPIIIAAFRGVFEFCELSPYDHGLWAEPATGPWTDIRWRDFFPPPPYSHLLTRPPELHLSPLETLITAMSAIPAPAIGVYQVLFQAAPPGHNWHRNIQVLLDIEYALKLQDGLLAPQRYAQQAPSGDLRHMAGDLENKAHNDKPVYSMAIRLAVIGGANKSESYMLSLTAFMNLFQHGGRPLDYLTEEDYLTVINPDRFREMLLLGLAYRPGFIVNSWELTGPVHVPPLSIIQNRTIIMDDLETLPLRNRNLSSGTWIGDCWYAGQAQTVCIPEDQRRRHTHLIGRSGMGKTSTQEHMILQDIEAGHGVAVLDPHGDLIERLLGLIPEHQVERTIYLNPGDPEWAPLWNPLDRVPGQDIGRMADDLVRAIKSFVSSGGWGDRLEHLLRNMIFGLIHLPHSTFLDLSNLLRTKSEESHRLSKEILKYLDNESARQFWHHDYQKYTKDDLGPPRNKLSKLLLSGTVSLMLSQPESRLSFRQIMDDGLILLINLSHVGSMVRGILGSFILSLLHLNALSRSRIPIEERRQFHIHCDEAHLIMTDTLEDLIAETRKYRVSLSLAHQYMSQFGRQKIDAFSSVGSTLIFNVDSKDAGYLVKDLRGLVEVDDLTSLETGQAVVRIGTDIVRVKMRPPLKVPAKNYRDRIIRESREKYCRPVYEIRKQLSRRGDRWALPFRRLAAEASIETGLTEGEFFYDEF